jgi:hypothetical protein
VKPAEPVVATVPAPTGGLTPRPAGEEIRWQPTGEPPRPAEGTWVPVGGPQQPGAARGAPRPIARGQVDDGPQPDPVGDLIRTMCRGRASGVEVRWTGTKRMTLCFESLSEAAAAKLVQDISARPELAPIQIDFRVLVK